MTVQNDTNVKTYTGNGVTTVFPYDFFIPGDSTTDQANLEVTLLEIATGIEGDPLADVLWSITGVGEDTYGNVTYTGGGTPLPATHKINIRRVVPYEQNLDLTTQSAYFPELLEEQLDLMVYQIQQLAEETARSVKVSIGASQTPDELIDSLTEAAADAEAAAVTAGAAATAATAAEVAAEAAQAAAEAAVASLANIPNSDLADMAEATVKGRALAAGVGKPQDLTATQATAILNAVVGDSGAGGTKGLVPAPAAGDAAANKFLKADGTWAAAASTRTVVSAALASTSTILAIPAGTTRITLFAVGASTNAVCNPAIRLGDAGGIEGTGYAAGGADYVPTANHMVSTTHFPCMGSNSSGAADTFTVFAVLDLLDAATFLWSCSSSYARTAATGQSGKGVGSKALSAALTQISFTTVDGTATFDAGTLYAICE